MMKRKIGLIELPALKLVDDWENWTALRRREPLVSKQFSYRNCLLEDSMSTSSI